MYIFHSFNHSIKCYRDGFAYKKYSKISGGQSLKQLDWDVSGDFIQTSSADFNINFWNTSSNKLEKVSSVLRGKDWADQTVVLGWNVAGKSLFFLTLKNNRIEIFETRTGTQYQSSNTARQDPISTDSPQIPSPTIIEPY